MSKPSFIGRGSTRKSDGTSVVDHDSCIDDRDDTKRKTRNLSEKKRRDQFNILINELNEIISINSRKMDKSSVLKSAISFLKSHNDTMEKSRDLDLESEWKPAFLSNGEFAHLILEAVNGFLLVLSTAGRILYSSDSFTSLLGHLQADLQTMSIFELMYERDQPHVYNMLLGGEKKGNGESVMCNLRSGGLNNGEQKIYELVQLHGYFRNDPSDTENTNSCYMDDANIGLVFVATGRLHRPLVNRDVVVDSNKSEFTSRHSLEWKFLFLDHRASTIIGYLPFEVLGTSGYNYYHGDDLDKLVTCHESLMQKGEAMSCHYRFLIKGQQWVWLQTRFYVTYHQWNSKPEFIVCTHHLVSIADMMRSGTPDPGVTQSSALRNYNRAVSRPRSQSDSDSNYSRDSPLTVCTSRSSPQASRYLEPHNYMAVSPSLVLPPPSLLVSSPQSLKRPYLASSLMVPSPQPHKRALLTPTVVVTSPQPHRPVLTPTLMVAPSLMVASPQPLLAPSLVLSSPQAHQLQNLSPLVLTSSQSAMQEQLQRKHQQLQQLISKQQAELRRVSKQLMMARCGVLPTPTDVTGSSAAGTTLQLPTADMFSDTLSPLAAVATRADTSVLQQQQYGQNELLLFELSQQQAQQLFLPPSHTGNNN